MGEFERKFIVLVVVLEELEFEWVVWLIEIM